jgi:hypothetical protein
MRPQLCLALIALCAALLVAQAAGQTLAKRPAVVTRVGGAPTSETSGSAGSAILRVPRPTAARPTTAGAAGAAGAPAPEPEAEPLAPSAEPDVRSAAGEEEAKAPGILARAKSLGSEALSALGDGLKDFWRFLSGVFG